MTRLDIDIRIFADDVAGDIVCGATRGQYTTKELRQVIAASLVRFADLRKSADAAKVQAAA